MVFEMKTVLCKRRIGASGEGMEDCAIFHTSSCENTISLSCCVAGVRDSDRGISFISAADRLPAGLRYPLHVFIVSKTYFIICATIVFKNVDLHLT
jgi:hypothetical protein